ncbi:hypothetical protein AAFH68_26140 [Flavobacterium sp. CGRL1]
MKKHVVVDGALCKCKFSEDQKTTDILMVKSQKKHFANDKGADKKLIATTKDVSQTLKKGTFGKCTLQPTSGGNAPCVALPLKWDNPYEKITLSNQGKILTEDSKAACNIGGPGCIEIFKHGQTAEVGSGQMQKADRDAVKQINPLLNPDDLDENDICFFIK